MDQTPHDAAAQVANDAAPVFEFLGTWETPVLATAIHTGHDLRGEVAELMVLDEADRLREEDPHTHLLGQLVPARVKANRSRFEVDLNRAPEKAVYRTPADCWDLRVWRDEVLPDDVVQRSLAEHEAFYTALAERLDEVAERGPFVVLDVHSYNHRRAGADGPEAPVEGNPEVNVGTGSLDKQRWGDVLDVFSTTLAAQQVQGHGLDVRENIRFKGANLCAWVHGRYPGRGMALALEFKKTFMDEWTGEFDAAHVAELSQALAATLDPLYEALEKHR